MTRGQKAVVAIIRDSGYACREVHGALGRWTAARFDGNAYVSTGQLLNARICVAMLKDGILRQAPGCGYGSCSFYEPVPDAD